MINRKKIFSALCGLGVLVSVSLSALPLAAADFWETPMTRGAATAAFLNDKGLFQLSCQEEWIPFSDLSKNHEHCDALITATHIGFLNGYEDGSLAPNRVMTRAEAAKMATLIYGLKERHPRRATYLDVPKETWFYGYVEALERKDLFEEDLENWDPSAALTKRELQRWVALLD